MTIKCKRTQWFTDARFGIFIHFGPYAQYGRGEQPLFRDFLDQNEYADRSMNWEAPNYNPYEWTKIFKNAGVRYAVMTTRHHDGFCLWNTKTTNYGSTYSKAQCDFIDDYVKACRKNKIRVGLYYSLADWRIPAYFQGPKQNPDGFKEFLKYVFAQVEELCTNYGKIDILWFDGAWPNSTEDWQAHKLVKMIRKLQPEVLINPRIGGDFRNEKEQPDEICDFMTSEREIKPVSGKVWESQDVSTWQWWGWHAGEHWKNAETVVDRLVETVSKGGNYLLNVGPKPDGTLPVEFQQLMQEVGDWMKINGESIYETDEDIVEFTTLGWQTTKGNSVYLIIRFWDGSSSIDIKGIKTKAISAHFLGSNIPLSIKQKKLNITIQGLPKESPCKIFSVIRIDFKQKPEAEGIFKYRLWHGDATRMVPWAQSRCLGKKVTDYRKERLK